MNSLYRFFFLATILLIASACGRKPVEPRAATPPAGASAAPATAAMGQLVGTLKGIAGASDAVAVLAPVESRAFTPSDVPAIMNQTGYEFIPHMLVAQAGQTVRFLNGEDVLHNVRVTEVANDVVAFNVATVSYGSYDYKFEHPGFYNSVVTQLQLNSPTDQTVRNPEYTANGTLDPARVLPKNAGFGAVNGAQAMRTVQVQLRFQF